MTTYWSTKDLRGCLVEPMGAHNWLKSGPVVRQVNGSVAGTAFICCQCGNELFVPDWADLTPST